MAPFPFPTRLAPPPTVYPPTQASQGAQVYYLVCMACHGDRGQGLTDEWRNVLNVENRNCWQSRCHASNHPLDGFVLPKVIPAVVGPGKLEIFRTALDLHDYLHARMPWQAPGKLSDEEYWQLTAYLMEANGFDPGVQPLDTERAAGIYLRDIPTPTPARAWLPVQFLESSGAGFWIASGGVMVLIALLVFSFWLRRARKQ